MKSYNLIGTGEGLRSVTGEEGRNRRQYKLSKLRDAFCRILTDVARIKKPTLILQESSTPGSRAGDL